MHRNADRTRGRPPTLLVWLGFTFRWLLVLLLALIAVGLLVSAVLVTRPGVVQQSIDEAIQRFDTPVAADGRPVRFVAREGQGAADIASQLEEQGLIRDRLLFRFLVYYYGVAANLQAGEYELSPAMTTTEIISHLHRGLVRVAEVTIPEGWRREEIAVALNQRSIFTREEFLRALDLPYAYDFLRGRGPGASSEGYLFPDTYRLGRNTRPVDFVDLMLRNFDYRFTPAMRQQAEARGLTIHQVVTLASIVEREAVVPAERPQIAAVFLNRLQLAMRLDADPTVQYALGNDPQSVARNGYWKQGLTVADLAVESPYNTYRIAGLPPGPICNPGLASIMAVLEPAAIDSLYFVAKGDGTHAFARTLEEQNENVRKYQR